MAAQVTTEPYHLRNPFQVTKAVDFTDEQINAMWVDWPSLGGFAEIINLTSPMARLIVGGKGTGRTHMMRHFSAPVQALRGGQAPHQAVIHDGVLGVYVVCSGLNASRFQGRGLGSEAWRTIFAQYTDLWLAQAALEAFRLVTHDHPPSSDQQSAIVEDIRRLLNVGTTNVGGSLAELRDDLYGLQREIDIIVNNAALRPVASPHLNIHSPQGTLVFGVPMALKKWYSPFQDITFLYLIDEFENFDYLQQRYINSLIRERTPATSFIIGVRTYGLRTNETLTHGEENKRGSEYEEINLEQRYTGVDRTKYKNFSRQVVGRRLSQEGLLSNTDPKKLRAALGQYFEIPGSDHVESLVKEHYRSRERRHFVKLRRDLSTLVGHGKGQTFTQQDVQYIIDAARVPQHPLLEKANAFLIYRAWSQGLDLLEVATTIQANYPTSTSRGTIQPNAQQQKVLNHFKTDLQAQLLVEMRMNPLYAGIDDFIDMSEGLQRNLLVILKNVFRWSLFNGEQPFQRDRISLASQQLGVQEASRWFLNDAIPLGEEGLHVNAAIHRLGEMFRRFRFSPKPAESSLISFSANLNTCSPYARHIIELADQHALITRTTRGQKDRNTRFVEAKFHLNRLLSPLWDLPIARRGAVRLSPAEVNAVFDPSFEERYRTIVDRRLNRMNPPFGNRSPSNRYQHELGLQMNGR